jgi:phage terminase small subunit
MEAGKALSIDQLDLMRRERLLLSKLTDKQKAFCESYVRHFNKLVALKDGGYWTPQKSGGSQAVLVQQRFENIMKSPSVQQYILLLKQSVASRLDISMDDIIDEYKSMAFTNMADLVEWDDKGMTILKSSKQLTKAQKAGIAEITETTTKAGTVVKIKLHNKQTALDRLFEILKSLEERETGDEGPAKISQTQINVILGDPIKRRAIEHLAESLFDRQISLVGTDKDRLEFEKHMEKITKKLLETTNGQGATSPGGAAIPLLPETEAGDGEGADGGDTGNKGQKPNAPGLRNNKTERTAQGAEEGQEEGELETGCRYDIDGL